MTTEKQTETEALAQIIMGALDAERFDPAGRGQFRVMGSEEKAASLDAFQDRPNTANACPAFYDVTSFAAYVDRFAIEATIVTADWRSRQMRAQIDYHQPGQGGAQGLAPSHNSFGALFAATFSPEYGAWRDLARRGFVSQKQFGEFLEERAVDVTIPAAADVMEMVMAFEVTRTAAFGSTQRLSNGTRQFQFIQNDQSKGAVQFPEQFQLEIPIYTGAGVEKIPVFVRYDIDSGNLKFAVKIKDQDRREQDAFEGCVDVFSAEAAKWKSKIRPPIYRGPIG